MKAVVAIATLVFVTASSGQVFKCVTPGGKVEYREAACDDAAHQKSITHGTTSGIDATSRYEMNMATRPAQTPQAPQQPIIIGAPKGRVPTNQEIKNLETSASSTTISAKEKQFLKQEVERAKDAQARQASYTEDDAKRLQEARAAQNRIDPKDRERARAEAEAIHMRAGSEATAAGIVADRQSEEARVEARRAAALQNTNRQATEAARAALPTYDRLQTCVGTNCTGRSGERYQSVPGVADSFRREDGKACRNGPGGLTCW